jgi:hypothetical protein
VPTVLFSSLSAALLSAGVLLWQCYRWAQDGHWTSVSINHAIAFVAHIVGKSDTWADSPRSWLGVYRLFDSVGVSVAGPVIAILLLLLMGAVNLKLHPELHTAVDSGRKRCQPAS